VLTDLEISNLAAFAERGALTLRQDVTDETRWGQVVDAALARHGQLDVLVNNAGIALLGNIETATLADWRKTQAINSESVFLGCREAVRAMKARGGSIVNISSVAGLIGDAQSVAYCASKGAVRLTTKSVALYCARKGYGIRCNSVHPSFTRTAMVEGFIATARNPARVREGLAAAAPLGRMGEAAEVAAAILYLASDESAFTTGAEIVVDGGLTAQ
jgi:NAD(P)-dependent dehydrogenase (short-subunit alcohol dehydrogenase family)